MGQFLIQFAQVHESFRLTELKALSDLIGIDEPDFSNYRSESPFLRIELPSVEVAARLVERSIICKSVYELFGYGDSYDNLHENLKRSYPVNYWVDRFKEDSFKFDIVSYLGTRSRAEQVNIINTFKYMALTGPIKMKNAEHIFAVLEDYKLLGDTASSPASSEPYQVFFGKFVAESSRSVVDKYDLKKRKYIGTTSFDAELSLLTCNIAQVTPGKFVYDPFVGTGSFLVAAGHFGGLCYGSDIDVRMIKGKSKAANIDANFAQYKTSSRFLDVMTVDFTHNSFRKDFKFDAIICDPPYGVREGLKVLGSKDPERFKNKEHVMIEGVPAHLRPDYIPPKKPYEFTSLLDDLLKFSAEHLVENGRLCFWMPTANADFTEHDIPHHEDLELLSNSVQEFNKWSRRLVSYRRRPYGEKGHNYTVGGSAPEEFRDKYFRGFKGIAKK
ncbi:Trm11p [Sugiyamaella lignohabitans]|uniref:tRNA (guanine(10)-N(2))-methyltransferase n=1 Tax=Sugiyamaella lignohabitans TaxID=796027 RepID=A0A167FHC9_9ASCO|nr:Trm11p [Sugiyamaella lignohabitans]ANB15299.1 Trm11p [Sugiyamaella lignohabitans]